MSHVWRGVDSGRTVFVLPPTRHWLLGVADRRGFCTRKLPSSFGGSSLMWRDGNASEYGSLCDASIFKGSLNSRRGAWSHDESRSPLSHLPTRAVADGRGGEVEADGAGWNDAVNSMDAMRPAESASSYAPQDVELELALELSRASFAQEQERRRLLNAPLASATGPGALPTSATSTATCDLIAWDDPYEKQRRAQLAAFNAQLEQLYATPLTPVTPNSGFWGVAAPASANANRRVAQNASEIATASSSTSRQPPTTIASSRPQAMPARGDTTPISAHALYPSLPAADGGEGISVSTSAPALFLDATALPGQFRDDVGAASGAVGWLPPPPRTQRTTPAVAAGNCEQDGAQRYAVAPPIGWRTPPFLAAAGMSSYPYGAPPSLSPLGYSALVVPFRPASIRLVNGDLIDLGAPPIMPGLATTGPDGQPLTYEELKYDFDPLAFSQRSTMAMDDFENEVIGGSPQILQRSQSSSDDHRIVRPGFLSSIGFWDTVARRVRKGRPPPPKPVRLLTGGDAHRRSDPVAEIPSYAGGIEATNNNRRSLPTANTRDGERLVEDVKAIRLCDASSEVEKQLELLRARRRAPHLWGSSLFISPIVDYQTTVATSVKITVQKDLSWPSTTHTSPSSQRLTFTCDVSSTVQQILETVLITFSNAESGEIQTELYGLKVFGFDEYLAPSSLIGQNAYVGQSLAFSDDIRLEVGRLPSDSRMAGDGDRKRERDHNRMSRIIGHHDKREGRTRRMKGFVVDREAIQKILDTLAGEMHKCERAVKAGADTTSRQAVHQSVKMLCALFCRVEPHDLVCALHSYDMANNAADLAIACSQLVIAIHRLLRMFCVSSTVPFDVLPLNELLTAKPSSPPPRREIVSVDERLLVCIESLHNLSADWRRQFASFYVAVHVFHGSAELCRGWREAPRPITNDKLFPYVRLNTWAQFDLPLCVIPRETRLCLNLTGVLPLAIVATTPASNAATGGAQTSQVVTEMFLASASLPLFDHNGRLRQGPLLLPFKAQETNEVKPWGPRPLVNPSSTDPVCVVTFPDFDYDIVFPHVENAVTQQCDFNALDRETQYFLEDIIENGAGENLSPDDKEVLWEKRHYLCGKADALALVLASAVGWDWACLNNIYQLIDDWTPLNPIQAIELLLPNYPDRKLREKAVEWIRCASSDFLFNFLPQLVEAVRFETFENSALATLLLDLSTDDYRFAFEVYWQLQQRIDHCLDGPYVQRCELLQAELIDIRGTAFEADVELQHRLLNELDAIAANVKNAPDAVKMTNLHAALSRLDASLLAEHVRLPLYPAFLATGFHVDRCAYFNSLTQPLKLSFRSVASEFGVLHKVGDDMRQDALVVQMVRMMNDIWLSDGLDLRMIVFRCLPTGLKKGMVELVKDCKTLREIQSAQGATGVFKDDVLKNWLQTQNASEFEYKMAVENFQRSCAGWCVATYVLGIGDRHNDNILVTYRGHVFHIDFGKYFGDWQMAAGFKRDRVPFIFTSDMAYVINDGSAQSTTEQYQAFVDNCCKAFNLIRRKYSLIINLIKLMICSEIPGMKLEAARFVQDKLHLNMSETEATVQFSRMIQESLASRFPRLNFFAHTLVQLRNAGNQAASEQAGGRGLSFVPQLYTERSDGRIESARVIGCEKWHTPEKVYVSAGASMHRHDPVIVARPGILLQMYKIEVRRKGETVHSSVYRSFEEFNEFYVKLCRRFPIVPLPPLSRGANIGRSNVRIVAERRSIDVQQFLRALFALTDEVAHCDLVYTFFHLIFRDSAPDNANRRPDAAGDGLSPEHRAAVISGQLFLRLSFNTVRGVLSVFVGHAKHLPLAGNGQPPDPYVKTYLRPDQNRITKRKTRIVKRTQNPTYNEELTYNLSSTESVLRTLVLEVTVWHYDSTPMQRNQFLGSVYIPLLKLDGVKQVDRRRCKVIESWYSLTEAAGANTPRH